MCNMMHKDSYPIKPSGYAWKLFNSDNGYALTSLIHSTVYRSANQKPIDLEASFVTVHRERMYIDGFCVFPSLLDVKKFVLIHGWDGYDLRRIIYAGGVSGQTETVIAGSFETYLVNAFTVLPKKYTVIFRRDGITYRRRNPFIEPIFIDEDGGWGCTWWNS